MDVDFTTVGREPVLGPCDCPVAIGDPELGPQNMNYPHTLRAHERESCHGWPPCGGCYNCIIATWAHWDRMAKAKT